MIIYSCFSNSKPDFEVDFIEYRADLTNDFFELPEYLKNYNTIITLRDSKEDGNYTGLLSKKINYLIWILKFTEYFIDIELNILDFLISEINDDEFYKRIIVSYHDFSENSIKNLYKVLKKYKLKKNIFMFKCVIKVDQYKDFYIINNFLKEKFVNYTFLTTGKTAKISRILYKLFGSKATYIGFKGVLTNTFQLSVEDLITYDIKNINEKTVMGGIIGNANIYNSLGLKYYNEYFLLQNINARYLPFETTELEDLLYLINKLSLHFYGFSITSPYKKQILKNSIINTYLHELKLYFSFDEFGFNYAFNKLSINANTTIIILGTGAMSELVIKMLPENEIFTISRNINNNRYYKKNRIKLNYFEDEFKYNVETYETTLNSAKDICLINATPLGANKENILLIYNEKRFNKVIDLPYTDGDTELIKYCKENKIQCVDGKEFWHQQFNKQIAVFEPEILRIMKSEELT